MFKLDVGIALSFGCVRGVQHLSQLDVGNAFSFGSVRGVHHVFQLDVRNAFSFRCIRGVHHLCQLHVGITTPSVDPWPMGHEPAYCANRSINLTSGKSDSSGA